MLLKKMIATAGTAGLLAAGSMGLATPAQAAGPVVTGGLVNVTLVDVVDVNNNQVLVPISVAATVCDVDVAVLAAIRDASDSFCETTSSAVPSSTTTRGPLTITVGAFCVLALRRPRPGCRRSRRVAGRARPTAPAS